MSNLIFHCDCLEWQRKHTITFDSHDGMIGRWEGCPFCKKPFIKREEQKRELNTRAESAQEGRINGEIGLIANRQFGVSDNLPTDETLQIIEGKIIEIKRRVLSSDQYRNDLVDFLTRFQAGEYTTLRAAEIIQGERDSKDAELQRLREVEKDFIAWKDGKLGVEEYYDVKAALLRLVRAEEASVDQFDEKEINELESAMKQAYSVLKASLGKEGA